MIDLITNNLEAIHEACRKHHVKELYLFGSAVKNSGFSDRSDLDFLYSFNNNEINDVGYADNFFDFKYELQDLLKREVDLTEHKEFRNPYFRKTVEESKRLIYAA